MPGLGLNWGFFKRPYEDYSGARDTRVGAATGMKVQDFYIQKRRGWVRLHEKGGKVNELPCHHNLDQYLEEWIATSGLGTEPEAPLFPTLRYGRLTDRTPLPQANVHMMIQRRARAAGLRTKISAHSCRNCHETFVCDEQPLPRSRVILPSAPGVPD